VIKLISVKTRRPDLSREEFRRHYEGRHVPLGLGFLERFRWRKYVRNHVVGTLAGAPDFDCLTEFWVASADDRALTREFVQSAEFQALDEDDRRFLDVTRRLSFEVEEQLLSGPPRSVDPAGTRRLAMLIGGPSGAALAGAAAELGRRLAAALPDPCPRITLDRRVDDEAGPHEIAAVLSLWIRAGDGLPAWLRWPGAAEPWAVVDLEVVETPPAALFHGAGETPGLPGSSRERSDGDAA